MSIRLILKNILLLAAVSILMNSLCNTDEGSNEAFDENRPVITSVVPGTAVINDEVVITGTNFGDSMGTSSVRLNGYDFEVLSWSSTSITVVVLFGMHSGIIIVTVNGLSSQSGPEAQLFVN